MDIKDKDENNILRTFSDLGSLGFTIVLITFAGLALGVWIDKITGFKPFFTLGGLFLGIFGVFLKLYTIRVKNKK
ncbi:MAG: AtpZ/AtpI family protein [Spirochaetia bacterium]|nr:AtpZ/AtpI family protein [Spirochaetia bacterium]